MPPLLKCVRPRYTHSAKKRVFLAEWYLRNYFELEKNPICISNVLIEISSFLALLKSKRCFWGIIFDIEKLGWKFLGSKFGNLWFSLYNLWVSEYSANCKMSVSQPQYNAKLFWMVMVVSKYVYNVQLRHFISKIWIFAKWVYIVGEHTLRFY